MNSEEVLECFIKGGEKSQCLRHRKGYTIVKYVLKFCECASWKTFDILLFQY